MSFISREVKPYFEKSIEPFVEFLSRKNVRPNHITVAGLLLVGAGSLFLYTGFTLPSLILLGAGALLDAVDGSLARKTDSHSEFGAFLDSTTDRVADALPFLALGVMYSQEAEVLGTLLSFLALIGSYGVSYTKARAEALGVYGLGGLFERTERWVVLLVGIAVDMIFVALFVIIVGSIFTILQRVYEVMRSLRR